MRPTITLLTLLSIVALPAVLTAQPADDTTEGVVEVGAWTDSDDGSPDVVTKFEPTGGGPDFFLALRSALDWGTVELDAKVRDSSDQDYRLDFDVNRSLRSETDVTILLHRLGFESLEHFTAATNHGRVPRLRVPIRSQRPSGSRSISSNHPRPGSSMAQG